LIDGHWILESGLAGKSLAKTLGRQDCLNNWFLDVFSQQNGRRCLIQEDLPQIEKIIFLEEFPSPFLI